MPDNNAPRPDSPSLKRLQTPAQPAVRKGLRTFGPLVLGAGLLCTIIAFIHFVMAFGGGGPPRLFWLFFVGMPLMAVGSWMCQFGFLGAVSRYVAGETAPVAADTINYVADETKGAVETVAKSAAQGIAEGLAAGRAAGEINFCPHCGAGVKAHFKFCPKCGKMLANG